MSLLLYPQKSHRRPHSDIVAVFECKGKNYFRNEQEKSKNLFRNLPL